MGDSNRQPMNSPPPRPELDADANVSVDVDGLDCYRAIHGLSQGCDSGEADPLWTVGIERARQLFDQVGVAATFFVVGRDLEIEAHRQQTIQLVESGHEIANHSYDHPYDLRRHPEVELLYQIEATNRIIADVTGTRPVGFRTPGYNVDADVIALSRRSGHRYDASVFPCISYWLAKAAVMGWRAMRGDRSKSDATDPKTLLSPRQPYFPDPLECWHPAPTRTGYVEIPVATFAGRMIPIIGTSLHLLDGAGLHRLWPQIDRSFPRFFNLEMHAIDFVDATDLKEVTDVEELVARQPDLRIPWHKKKERYRRLLELMTRRRVVATLAEATASI